MFKLYQSHYFEGKKLLAFVKSLQHIAEIDETSQNRFLRDILDETKILLKEIGEL